MLSIANANRQLLTAIFAGDAEGVQDALDRGADVNHDCGCGFRPIHAAASVGVFAIMQSLLLAGADPNIEDYEGRNALDVAFDDSQLDSIVALGIISGGFASVEAARACA